MVGPQTLHPAGSTGNTTLPAGVGKRIEDAYKGIAFQFVVEAIGATPTITYKFQGSVDGTNWFDISYVTDASDTPAVATKVRTTAGADLLFLANPIARHYEYFRCVPSANTNVTFRSELYIIEDPS